MPQRTYLINKNTNKKYVLNGVKRSTRLPQNVKLSPLFASQPLFGAQPLPPKVDLRSQMTLVEDQSQLSSCTANSLAGAYEFLTKKADGRGIDVSRLFIYYNARTRGNDSEKVEDVGCALPDAVEALQKFGVCLESLWPYELSRVDTRPSDEAYQQAKEHRINEATPLEINLNEMKTCLAQGFPFAFGLELFSSFDKASESGVVPAPDPNDTGRASHGCHAMLAVGYSDQSNAFIVRNSWGENWGDHGYCYIPYDYMTNPDFCFDAWAIRKIMPNDFAQDHWSYDDNQNYLDVDPNKTNNETNDNADIIETFDDLDYDTKYPVYEVNTEDWQYNYNDQSISDPTIYNQTTNVEYLNDTSGNIPETTFIDNSNYETTYSYTEYFDSKPENM